jgi:hypothetical protein
VMIRHLSCHCGEASSSVQLSHAAGSLNEVIVCHSCSCFWPTFHPTQAGVELTIDDFQSVSDRVPFIADLKPSGRYVMEDVHQVSSAAAPNIACDLTVLQSS